MPIIDAHQHFWDLSLGRHPWLGGEHQVPFRYGDYSAIRRDYLPDDYARDSANFDVVKTVHMEAEWDPADPLAETAWLMDLNARTGRPNAIVGQAWFARDDIADVLAGHAACPLMRSIRQKPAAAPSREAFRPRIPGSMADPAFRAGYALLGGHGLHYDLQTPWWHLGEAADLARDFPETTVILNHTGLPADRSREGLDGWRAAMETFAAQPNAMVKISGICVPRRAWTADLNREVVLDTIAIFGADRAMFASNFPVDSLWASFDEIFGGFLEITAGLPEADRRKLFHDNAERVYRPV
jgi:predicted TIM-barrel fold metal-dependent hydrolase